MESRVVIVVKAGAPPQKHRLIEANLLLGSSEQSTLVIKNPTVSRRHALLRKLEDGEWELVDLGSTNGTYVNGRRIASPTRVKAGDQVMLGAVVLELRVEETGERVGDGARNQGITGLKKSAKRSLKIVLAAGLAGFVYAAVRYASLRPYRKAPLSRGTPFSTAVESKSTPGAPTFLRVPTEAATKSAQPPNSAASVSSIAPSAAAPTAASKPWLTRLNYYRSLAKVTPVVEDTALSEGDLNHARYLVKNFKEAIRQGLGMGAIMHQEDPNNLWFTPSGMRAAQHSNVEQWYNPLADSQTRPIDLVRAVDGWIKGPFHRLALLSPMVSGVGYGAYCEDGVCASAIELPTSLNLFSSIPKPVMFPGPDSEIGLRTLAEGEWPRPLASCPGYAQPAGLAVTLQLNVQAPVVLSAHEFDADGISQEHCAFDATSYQNPNAADQEWGRKVLASFGAVVLIPRYPLRYGTSYHVSLTANGQRYDWSFKVARRSKY